MRPLLDEVGRQRLADALREAAEHVIPLHALRSGRCRAAGDDNGAIVEPFVTPHELIALGNDADTIAEMLPAFEGWNCLEAAAPLVERLSTAMRAKFGRPVRRYEDLFFTLSTPAPPLSHPAVRLLTENDADLYERCAPLFGDNPIEARRTVLEGPVAAAIVDGVVVSAVEANVRTTRYANLTAATLPAHQNRGLATACAAAAARAVQAMGLIPVWSSGEGHLASQCVAKKLGFTESSRWTFLSLA
jgi:hypothetical protein